ncbi:SLAM family member 5 isoform X3 [Xenopus tropicalis]|uniref:SLAM family member 5 isoform X3 n=1 Tax=Xenopus tropicalis TaxID=8364 RepID=A0A8J1IQE3_XENTR|nr:SLAM family member 5 isoform X3 [Xenopus tropicalis]
MFCLFIHLSLSFLFPAASPANQGVPLRVNGLEKHSAYLKIHLDLTVPVLEVLWLFKPKEKEVRLADFQKPHFEIRFPQFHNRLEPLDSGTTLRISDLRMEDSGIYTAAISYTDQETKRLTFNLTVYANQDVPKEVDGLEQHSVCLQNDLDLTVPVLEVLWLFKTKEREVRLAYFRKPHFEIRFPQFHNRLEPLDSGTTLRISDLRMEDSGIYTAAITYTDEETKRLTFNLTVYEPVPTPHIWIEGKKQTTEWCNFTARCSVKNNDSALTFTWINKPNKTEYLAFSNGTVVASVESPTSDKEFHCLLENPVDQKNASIHVQTICSTPGELQRYYLWFIPLFLIILIALLVWLAVARKKRKKIYNRKSSHETKTTHSLGFDNHSETEYMPHSNPQETQYIIVGASPQSQSSSIPEVQRQYLQNPKLETIYTTIRS